MTKHEIARIFDEIGLLLELKGQSPFKSRAYHNAARTLENVTDDISDLVATGRVRDLPGIGSALSGKLAELVSTGRLLFHDELKRGIPPRLLELATLPGLGPKKVMVLYEQLGVASLGELEYACIENRLLTLPGFGQKTQDRVRQSIASFKRRQGYHLYADVVPEATRLCATLDQTPGVRAVALVGDLRRRLELVQNISLLAAADGTEPVLTALRRTGAVEHLEAAHDSVSGTSIRGIPVSVAVVRAILPHVLLAATGSTTHVAALAARAAHRHVRWNLNADSGLQPLADSEEALYAALGLPFIEPELREGMGEIEETEAGRLRRLVQSHDLQGIFHAHTTYSDGASTLEEMVAAARTLGYRYIGISDHSQSAFYARGLKEDRIREQQRAIEALQSRMTDMTILKGIESDILLDGSLDYPDEVLARLDFVIGSVHSRFNLGVEEQTARVVRALENPYLSILGHPSGRLLLSREGYRLDMHQVIEAACRHRKVIEINASPHRLDLDWRLCRMARTRGVRFSINPDAHSTEELHNTPFGINVARKAGLGPSDVLNTRGATEALEELRASH